MKIFQIVNGICHYDATNVHPDLCSTEGHYPPDVLFVEAPDYVFEGWGYVDGEFIKPTPPEGWLYDDATGTFYPEPPPKTLEGYRFDALQRIDGKCSAAIFSGFDLNGKHYTATMLEQSNIKDALLAFELGKTIYPYAALGEERTPHTKQQITEIANGMSAWGLVCTGYYAQLKIWIARETDENILSTIDFGSNLPDDLMQALATELNQYGISLADYAGLLSK